jgi:hypothetical protein
MATTPSLASTPSTEAPGYPGSRADASLAVIDTWMNESATAIDFGVPVCPGTLAGAVKPIATDADADLAIGIAMRDPTVIDATPSTNVLNYPRYKELAVMRIGRVYAIAAENVQAGDQVLIITGSSAAQAQATAFGSSHGAGGVAGTGRRAFKGAVWRQRPHSSSKTIAAGDVGIIEFINQNLGVATT